MFKLLYNCTHFTCSQGNKIFQARLQQYVNQELPDVQARFRKGRGNHQYHWIIEKAREFQKNIYFCFIDYAKAFDCVDHNKLWKILRDENTTAPDLCKLRDLHKARFTKRTRPALYRNRSPLMRRERATVRLVSCCTYPRKE